MSLLGILDKLEKHGDEIFIASPNYSISFNDFVDQVGLFAEYFSKTLSSAKTNIGILVESKSIACELYLGVLKSGNNAAILDFNKSSHELEQFVSSASISMLICSRKDQSNLNMKCSTVFVEEMVLNTCQVSTYQPEDIYGNTIMQTSGTSGCPKNIKLSIENLLANARLWSDVVNLSSDITYIHAMSLSTVGGLGILWRALVYRFSIYVSDARMLKFKKINNGDLVVSLVPTMLFDIINRHGASYLADIDLIILGGEPINDKDLSYLKNLDMNIFMAYGMTETASGISGKWIRPNCSDRYLPFSDVSVMVSSGRIYISGPMVSRTLESQYYKSGYMRTDDTGFIDSKGICVTGRADRTIISGAKKIDPFEVEEIIYNIPGVIRASVFSESHKRWGQMVVASIYVDKNSEIDESIIDGHCRAMLSGYKLPKKYYIKKMES